MVRSLILYGVTWICFTVAVFSQPFSGPVDSLLRNTGAHQAGIHATNGSLKGKGTLWTDAHLPGAQIRSKNLHRLPQSFRLLQLDTAAMKETLKKSDTGKCYLEIPLPSGGSVHFELTRSSVMHPDLGEKFPQIKTFKGSNVDNGSSSIRLVWAPGEFHAMAFMEEGAFFIDKVQSEGEAFYISYFSKDLPAKNFTCELHEPGSMPLDASLDEKFGFGTIRKKEVTNNWNELFKAASPQAVGTELRKYRFALAVPGELTQGWGGVPGAMAQVAILMNDLNGIVERDLCVTFELIPNNDTLIYDDPATDPYSNGGIGAYLSENLTNVNTTIGAANFDIGHVLNTTSGGVAYLGVFCNNSFKAGGTSAANLGVFSHEVGHQMGADHSHSCCGCLGSYPSNVEPGDGNTIMTYHGNCGLFMPGGDLFHYHTDSYDEIFSHLIVGGGNTCPTMISTGHTPPTVSVPASGFTIPILTPFTLKGTATDDGGNAALTYLWEQNDQTAISSSFGNPNGNAAIFRSYPYTGDSTRTFPELSKIISGNNDRGELIPTYSRDFNFRFMVHDNHPGMGGVDYGHVTFRTDENAGPFEVKIPNDQSTVWSKGQNRTVSWEVANTDVAPVSCATVHILASFDGGLTYPDTLAAAVANDGSHDVAVPDTVVSTARIRVEAADNIFFDISDEDFQIVSDTVQDFCLDISPATRSICGRYSVVYQIDIVALGAFSDPVYLTLNNLPAGVVSGLPGTVAATASINLTLSNLSPLAAGHYAMPFTAENADGSVSHSETIYLVLRGETDTLVGHSMSFDGNDYVEIADIGSDFQFGDEQSFTVDFWVKTASTGNNKVMLAKKDWSVSRSAGWLFYIRSGKVRWVIADGDDRLIVESPTIINDGDWHHVVGVLDRTGVGKLQIYVDGHLGEEEVMVNRKSVKNNLPITFGSDSDYDYKFTGELDEIRIWRTALSANEIRERMHRIADGCLPDLISNWQFNETSGNVTDKVSHYNGTVTGATRAASTIPVGMGTAQSKTETSGVVDYSGTDFSADYSLHDAADVTATLLNLSPHGTTGIAASDTIFDSQYWIVNRYEKSGPLKTDLTFGLNEDITAGDVAAPYGLRLYKRNFNSTGDWSFLASGSAADSTLNTVTFPDVSSYGQYLITRTSGAAIGTSITSLDFCRTAAANEVLSYFISGLNLNDTIHVLLNGNFEISLDSVHFDTALTLVPINGAVPSTKIFVRSNSSATNFEVGQAVHTSAGTNADTVDLSSKVIGVTASHALSGSGGEYLSLPRDPELIFGPTQDFTIECWIYTDASIADPSIISNKNWNSGSFVGWGLFFLGHDWKVNINGTSGSRVDLNSDAPDINDGQWHHLAVVFDRDDQLSIYQDGFLTNQTSLAGLNGLSIDAGYPINILQDGTGTYSIPMAAKIDELRFWNTTRTTQQIRENMHLTLSCSENDLVAYYQFNESSGDCLDLIGGHHGELKNGAVRINSDAPSAGGISVTKTINAGQLHSFDNGTVDTGLDIDFSGILPNGDVVVSHLTEEAPHGEPTTPDSLLSSYWVVNNYGSNTSGFDAEMIFQAPNGWAEFADPADYSMFKRPSTAISAGSWIATDSAATVHTSNDQLSFTGVTAFSQFVISKCSDCSVALPVELMDFEAIPGENSIALQWQTATEINVDEFEIQRSEDGHSFWEVIGQEKGRGSSGHNLYGFIDKNVVANRLYYYRLKFNELNGQFAFSAIVTARVRSDILQPVIYPNPSKGAVYIETALVKEEEIKFELVDLNGAAAFSQHWPNGVLENRISIDLSALSAGFYLANLKIGPAVFHEKIILTEK
ncbi:MAG: LamG-like jellyroll fold domain-containing protein [Bacteroidota bacterium]